MEQKYQNNENLKKFRERIGVLLAGRIRDISRMKKAIEIQDRLRKKSGKWNGTETIRKWRDKR